MKHFLFTFSLIFLSFRLFGQSINCNTQQLHRFLIERGVASKEDESLTWCKPMIIDQKGDGVYAFGVNETDSFTYFLTKAGNDLFFIKEHKIDFIMSALSKYFNNSQFSFTEKSKCYKEVINVLEEENQANSHWSLPK